MNVSEALTILSQKATSKNLQKVRLTIDGTQQRNEVTLDGKVVSYQSRVISFLCPKTTLLAIPVRHMLTKIPRSALTHSVSLVRGSFPSHSQFYTAHISVR